MEEIILTPKEQYIQKLIITIVKKDAVIFCRVSSIGQTGPTHISFEVQERKGQNCASLFELKIKAIVKVVESAYTGEKSTIKSLISKYKGKNIIIYNVSRFSRSIERGLELLNFALKNNTRIFFVEEGIVWDKNTSQDDLNKLREKLFLAEEESKAIARRVKDALAEKKRRGFFTGGQVPYGYDLKTTFGGKIMVKNEEEWRVIDFIKLCKKVGTDVKLLNYLMSQISPNFDEPIVFYYGGTQNYILNEALTNGDIANLLNVYGVTKRGNSWTSGMISAILKRDYDAVVVKMEEIQFGF